MARTTNKIILKRTTYSFFLLVLGIQASRGSDYCLPGDLQCFPSSGDFATFSESISGNILTPLDPMYKNYTLMKNTWTTKYPFIIVLVTSNSDIQTAILFARKYNLRVTIKGTGHDYNGRSTGHGVLEINLSKLKSKKVRLNTPRSPSGEIELGAGNTWLEVYKEVDKYYRLIIGASAHTVGMGGYTLGGGHSPICRMFGLAVDNLLEVEMVAADGSVVTANNEYTLFTHLNGTTTNSTNTDIFWALRGGGGGTFGVATKFTFRLHQTTSTYKFVRLYLEYPIILPNGTNIGRLVLRKFYELLAGMPNEWGGYILADGFGPDPNDGTIGSLKFFLNHFGGLHKETRQYMDQMVDFLPDISFSNYIEYKSFLEYEKTALDPAYYMSYMFNTLISKENLTTEFADFVIDSVMSKPTEGSSVFYTGTLMGGNMMQVREDATAVHPGFRKGVMSLTGGIGWENASFNVDKDGMSKAGNILGERLAEFGDGMYPNDSGPQVKSWKKKFWGSNYKRLLQIKRQWDPDNFFRCLECVGSEIKPRSENLMSSSQTIKAGGLCLHSVFFIYILILCRFLL